MINPNQLGRSPFPAGASQWMLVGLRGGAVVTPPFDPTSIAGLKPWLKADALSLSDGDPVTTWADSSGSGYDVASSGAQRPIYHTGIVNGKPALQFVSVVSQFMQAKTSLGISQPDTIFIVAKTVGGGSGRLIDVATGARQLLDVDDPATGHFRIFAGTLLADAVNYDGAFHVFAAVFNGASSFGYVDGTQTITGNAGSAGVGNLVIGSDTTAAFMTGYIAEVLIYNSALSGTDRGNVETYLKTKYAIP